ncbi:hypothetical protein D6779_04465 [Candidatus Parcubacteria bacterium]|nr:MAG: hypothetical protein D6779_04465 [Candidatus Parcubacteria bacterium]
MKNVVIDALVITMIAFLTALGLVYALATLPDEVRNASREARKVALSIFVGFVLALWTGFYMALLPHLSIIGGYMALVVFIVVNLLTFVVFFKWWKHIEDQPTMESKDGKKE